MYRYNFPAIAGWAKLQKYFQKTQSNIILLHMCLGFLYKDIQDKVRDFPNLLGWFKS